VTPALDQKAAVIVEHYLDIVHPRLSGEGVNAVQTLSRLNRTAKGKTETFVIDFVLPFSPEGGTAACPQAA
jgi:hypothetical protein